MYGYRCTRFVADERCLHLHIQAQPHKVCCPACGQRKVIRRSETSRSLRNVLIAGTRDGDFFLLKLDQLHETKYAFAG
jgi:predicted RNA-binding Zn-ribbon protein involved in translation (DUF1610 family)